LLDRLGVQKVGLNILKYITFLIIMAMALVLEGMVSGVQMMGMEREVRFVHNNSLMNGVV
jgi:hypothetical protein